MYVSIFIFTVYSLTKLSASRTQVHNGSGCCCQSGSTVQHVSILYFFNSYFLTFGYFFYSKRDSAQLAQEQSNHLFLCVLVADLTQRYGPVVRQAKVVGVLEAAFDVLVPEFGIEKRVHVDQMPIDVSIK